MASLASWYNTRHYPGDALSRGAAAQGCEQEQAELVSVKESRVEVPARRFRLPSFRIRPILFFSLNALHRAVDWGLLAAIGLSLVLFSLQFPHSPKWDRFWFILQLRELGNPVVARFAVWARSEWPSSSTSYLPLGLALAGWMVKSAVNAVLFPILGFLRRHAPSRRQVLESMVVLGGGGVAVAADSEQARALLLRRYREIEGALKAAKRKRCAFLSIDVVGSTQMKDGERELAITVTFRAYMEMLEEIFNQYSAWKQAWTPDGVMVCFLQLDVAVAAAQIVLQRLRTFNRTQNLLRTRITVRCGLNEGEIAIFEDSHLEKIAHRVIDVTGHMQKQANPNTLWLSAEVHDLLRDKSGFRRTGKEVDGHKVYEWSPSLSLPEQPAWAPDSQRN